MKKILVVDDVEENRYVLKKLLESGQNKIILAENGRDALKKAQNDLPDLIISDILMPVMDGYSLCKICKSDERLKHIPFVFYTSTYTDPKDEAFALKLGADLFLIKPQEPHIFVELLKDYIQDKHPAALASHQPLGSEMEFFRQYNEVLYKKLEQKVVELEKTNQRLNQEIDEHRRAKEKLFNLTQLVQESPVAVFITDIHGDIEYVNPKFLQISGYSDGELKKKNWKAFKSDEMRPDVYEDISRSMTSDKIWKGELCGKRKNGESFWVHLTLWPFKDKDGRTINFMAMMEDLSERMHLEAQLRQAQKLESIGQLAGGVAHGFNNILTAIMGYAQLAQANISKDDPLKGHVQHILDYSEKATVIIKSLLTFSRKQTLHLSHYNLNDLVSSFQELLRHLLPRSIEIQTQLADSDLPVLVDSNQIEQIIMNLASNARDVMPQGGHFVISTSLVNLDDKFIKVHGYGRTGSYAEIAVADTGTGMDKKTLAMIFDPFFTTKEQGKGSGLGMAIVYGIVKQHNGFIIVESELDKGTLFRILFPIDNEVK